MKTRERQPINLGTRLLLDTPKEEIPQFCLFRSVFFQSECQELLERYGNHKDLGYGVVGNGDPGSYELRSDLRLAKTVDITEEQEPWLYERLRDLIREANKVFKFDLYGLLDDFVFTQYDSVNGGLGHGKFSWHTDAGRGMSGLRKLSVVVSLNDALDYEGGEFQTFGVGPTDHGQLPQGSVAIIPSYVPHQVLPVTKGVRTTLIMFVLGPRLR